MQRTTLEINRVRFVLPGDIDQAAMKESFRRAARSGGDFVAIPGPHNTNFDVLVTPATNVVIREEPVEDIPPLSDEEASALADLETGASKTWTDCELDY
jgi:hypothetical protein